MKTTDCETTICPPRELTRILIQRARDLQMLPDVAVRAIAIADNPNARINDLVNIVGQDIKLTTNILAFSNSPLFGFGVQLASLQQAITRVGLRQTKNMILASSFTSMLQSMDWQEIRIRDLLCWHSFLTGIISSKLNTLFQLGMQGEEFTAGLVHDVGRTLLAVSIPHEFERLDPLSFVEGDDILESETKAIGTTHAEIGAWFLQRNHLPEELIHVARFHHNPHESPIFKRLVALVAVADDMANFSECCTDFKEYDCSELPSLQLLESLGVENATNKLVGNAHAILKSSVKDVSRLIKLS